MRRRAIIVGLTGAAALTARSVACAQQPPQRIPRVVILSRASTEARPVFAAFRDGLRALGWIEGRNIVLEFHLAHGDAARLTALAQAIARDGADVVLADGGVAATIHAATRTIPIVAIGGMDVTPSILAASLARPGGNVTGIATFTNETALKQLEVLHELAPSARRIGAIASTLGQLRPALEEAASSLGLTLRFIDIANSGDVARELAPAALGDVDGLLVAASPVVAALSALVVARIDASRKPAVYAEREFIDAGGLISYGIDHSDLFRRLAGYVDRILKGANPAEMPIERPVRIQLIVNLQTARALGLTIPPVLLARADEVIE